MSLIFSVLLSLRFLSVSAQYFGSLPSNNPASSIGSSFLGGFFGTPRTVRVPGRIEIIVRGENNVAEILCEFPRWMLLVQTLHWHHTQPAPAGDPYGSYFDIRQNFAPRVTVYNEGRYKSILRLAPFTEDDFGTWRCLSAALLPEGEDMMKPWQQQATTDYRVPGWTGLGPYAPFYRPTWGVFGVVLEVKFGPSGQLRGNYSGLFF